MSEDSERMNTPCPQAAVATIMLPWTATSSLDRHWIPFPDRAKQRFCVTSARVTWR
jgi:hypothetical protein